MRNMLVVDSYSHYASTPRVPTPPPVRKSSHFPILPNYPKALTPFNATQTLATPTPPHIPHSASSLPTSGLCPFLNAFSSNTSVPQSHTPPHAHQGPMPIYMLTNNQKYTIPADIAQRAHVRIYLSFLLFLYTLFNFSIP
jgi:hypothetical protein